MKTRSHNGAPGWGVPQLLFDTESAQKALRP